MMCWGWLNEMMWNGCEISQWLKIFGRYVASCLTRPTVQGFFFLVRSSWLVNGLVYVMLESSSHARISGMSH